MFKKNCQKIVNDLLIDDSDFTLEELLKAKESLCEGEAAGPDEVTPEDLKGCQLDDTAKLVNKMLLNRIQSKMDSKLRYNQNGFTPGRSKTARVLALRRHIEGVRSHNRRAIITFVDFKKAFG